MEALTHEWMFYEVMWRIHGRGYPLPVPWWVQQYLRHWTDSFDSGLFDTRESAFASNANYRYWNMIGVKDAPQECLVGQAGEIEPVYDEYTVSFFLFDPISRQIDFPQIASVKDGNFSLHQQWENSYLPIIITTWESRFGCTVEESAFATPIAPDQKSTVLTRFKLTPTKTGAISLFFGLAVSPIGPTGFKRHDKAKRYRYDRRLTFMNFLPTENRVLINTSNGPIFDSQPSMFGTYGNGNSLDPNHYLDHNPYNNLVTNGTLNGNEIAVDYIGGMCSGAFMWPVNLSTTEREAHINVLLPVDDFRGDNDIAILRAANFDTLEKSNQSWWFNKLNIDGFQAVFPHRVEHLWDIFRICRANLLILADNGQIHPGPTIYDEFWIRDSSIEAIACAFAGDQELARKQLGYWHPDAFNFSREKIDGISLYGFFGRKHEKEDREWDSNGEALWAFGRFDRITGGNFGRGLFTPYIIDGARWIRDNRTKFGLLHSGWSAEHIGDRDHPHYWDDFWGVAGLWEAARLAQRIGAEEAHEIWTAYDALRNATADSIRWVLDQQKKMGYWETFIPTGPGDVGLLNSSIIGVLSYFHPCRLYDGIKLGADIDYAARMTVETIWNHFMDCGFRHDSAWNCYGPYLTMQLAHTFLFLGDIARMDQCLLWLANKAAYPNVNRQNSILPWQVALGGWNEQHCYPIAKNFSEFPERTWYMGDIPHGWACAEFITLLRDILFFESDEDGDAKMYIAPGVMPHWINDGEEICVKDAPTIFGQNFGYRLKHNRITQRVEISITQPLPTHVSIIYPCRFGNGIQSVIANGKSITPSGRDIQFPSNTTIIAVTYH